MAKSVLDAYDTDETTASPVGSAVLDAYDTGDTGAPRAPVSGGILPNLGKGVLQGTAGTINTVTDPAQALVYNPLAIGASYAAPWIAQHVFGMGPDRADKLAREIRGEGDQATVFGPPAGTAAIHGIGTVVGKQPEDVPTGTTTERIASETARGAVNPLMPGSLPAATLRNVGASVGGGELANVAPEWLKPGAELVGNVVGGYVEPSINLLARPFTGSPPPMGRPPPFLGGVKPPDAEMVAGATSKAGETTPVSPSGSPRTPDEAKAVADIHYKNAESAGGSLSGDFTNGWIAKAGKLLTSEAEELGPDAATKLRDNLGALQDQPLSLSKVQAIDEKFGDAITEQVRAGNNKVAGRLRDAQQNLRDAIDGADETDVGGDKTGFDALSSARKAWQQYRKMDDLQRMYDRSQGTANPSTSFKTQINNLRNNKVQSRGYSDDELAALKDAGERGVITSAMTLLGSRLLPMLGFGTHGPGGALAMAGINEAARAGLSKMQNLRFQNAMDLFGSSVPMPPGVTPSVPYNPNMMMPTPWSFQSLPDITSQQRNPLAPPP